MDDFEKELKAGFLTEAEQSLVDVEQCFLDLESNPRDAENLNKIFRLAHNLKGSSKAVGFDELGALTHEFETFILKIKNGELDPSDEVVSFLLRCNDFLRGMVDGLKSDMDAHFEIAPLIEEMHTLNSGGGSVAVVEETPVEEVVAEESSGEIDLEAMMEAAAAANAAEVAPAEADAETPATPKLEANDDLLAELMAMGVEMTPDAVAAMSPAAASTTPSAAAAVAPVPKVAPAAAPVAAASAPAAPKAPGAEKPDDNLRVSLAKVESLLNVVGEMVILQSVLREQGEASSSDLLRKTILQLTKVGKEIQDISMSLRMVSVKPTFQKMQRIVRDTSKALSKDVQIQFQGEDSEIDKTVLEKINDPLVHLVRNSVDHGIESAEVRTERGKPSKGTVRLAAYHEGGRFVIEITDDGGGLNPEILTRKAIEKRLIPATAKLTPTEAYNLIFLPGFSTKEQVTETSGRGVGMDVVKTNIQELGGEIQISSELTKGTTMRILLPLTLAIIDGMIVTTSGHRFVIPLTFVHETLKLEPAQVHKTQVGEILTLRGENLPIYRLGDFFGIKSDRVPDKLIALVIRSGAKTFAMVVDDVVSQTQVVVKQLGGEFKDYRGVSGSTILGDGRPAFILEPPELMRRGSSTSKISLARTGAAA